MTGYTQLGRGFLLNEMPHILKSLQADETQLHAGVSPFRSRVSSRVCAIYDTANMKGLKFNLCQTYFEYFIFNPFTTGYMQLKCGFRVFVTNETRHIFGILHADETCVYAAR